MVLIYVPNEHNRHLLGVSLKGKVFLNYRIFVGLRIQILIMIRFILTIAVLSQFTISLHAQDAAMPEGQKAIDHRTRFYEGTPIKKFSPKIYSFQLEGKKFSTAPPAIYEGVAFAGADSGEIVTVTSSEMKRKYKLENAGAVEGAPAVTKENVFVGFKNNLFAAFSREDGKLLWKYETKGPVTTTPLVHEKLVYFTTSNGYCYGLNAETGAFKWRFNILSKASSPAYDNDIIFVGNDRQCIFAINAKNGDQVWQYIGAGGQPVVGEVHIYAVEKVGSVVAIDKRSGQRDWHFKGDLIEGTTDLALAKNTLVFGNATTVLALNSRMGEGFKWKKELLRSLTAGPIIVGGITYITCLDGKIYALDLETGHELDRIDLGFMPHAAPAFGKDVIIYPNGEQILIIGGE